MGVLCKKREKGDLDNKENGLTTEQRKKFPQRQQRSCPSNITDAWPPYSPGRAPRLDRSAWPMTRQASLVFGMSTTPTSLYGDTWPLPTPFCHPANSLMLLHAPKESRAPLVRLET